jgi:putative flippase GtrA
MSLGRHARHYAIIGGIQWLVDWGVMVGLTHLGMAVEPANVIGRISGALLGFWLNGRVTFAGEHTEVGRTQLQRFVLMWLCTTAASTWAMGGIDDWFGLKWAWLAKPGVELVLGAIGFVLSRHWVYRRSG